MMTALTPAARTGADHDRKLLLDLLRGLAAIAVIALHVGDIVFVPLMPGGYLAVDFFFVLSGYVIATAYDRRLSTTMRFGPFVGMRLIRLYPLFLVGAGLGLVKVLAQSHLHARFALDGGQLVLATVSNLLMLPYLLPYPSVFPLNAPAWSLSFELFVNLLYAWILFRARTLWIVALAVAAAVVIVAGPMLYGTDRLIAGSTADRLPFGLARVLYGFPIGMLLARLPAITARPSAKASMALAAVLLLCLALPLTGAASLARDLAFVLAGGPLLVWAGSRFEVPPRWRRVAAFLGDLSYPLYILHYPIVLSVAFIGLRQGFAPATIIVASLVIVIAASIVAMRYYDGPVRVWLSRRYHRRESAMPLSATVIPS
ncbi:peptidoglycan/LPS O-acetylase OafA/YrhL [Sphingomonas sp. PvP018]|nr:peptidoglycan/LPS O-acetylase OafA/YrhL [Sphingomonas sp. PvP018]